MKTNHLLLQALFIFPFCLPAHCQKDNLRIVAGLKNTPLEYLGGPLFGFTYAINETVDVSVRKDMLVSIGKSYLTRHFVITDYHSYHYLDAAIKMGKTPWQLGGGLAWIYKGVGYNEFLNRESGYPAATVFCRRRIEWLDAELRFDIPLGENQKIIDQGYLAPLSIAVMYGFSLRR